MSDDKQRLLKAHRIDAAGQILTQALQAQRVDIKDVSHRHRRHAEAQDGRAHFQLTIISEQFEGLATLARHRLVYEALDDMMKTDIHALAIKALTPTQDSDQ